MENTVLKAIYERRSVRHFAPQAVEPEKIYEVSKGWGLGAVRAQ